MWQSGFDDLARHLVNEADVGSFTVIVVQT